MDEFLELSVQLGINVFPDEVLNCYKEVTTLTPLIEKVALFGSSAVLKEGFQDVDFACLTSKENFEKACAELKNMGFKSALEEYNISCIWGSYFSLRRGMLNVILFSDEKYFKTYKAAGEVFHALREKDMLKNKLDRIILHEAIVRAFY